MSREQMKDRIVALWGEGKSASQIATILNEERGTSHTRSVICGLIHRMRNAGETIERWGTDCIVHRTVRKTVARGPRRRKAVVPQVVVLPARVDVAAPDPCQPVPLLRLGLLQCRTVVGTGEDGLATFCGMPIAKGSYCAPCASRYFIPDKRRAA